MTVQKVLAAKGNAPSVFTIPPDATVQTAVEVLRDKHIGVVLVSDGDGRPKGILSERDVVRVLADDGARALDWPVEEVMTRDVVTCGRDDPIVTVMGKMSQGHLRHVPIVEDGRLYGMVSMTDVVRYRLDEVEQEAAHLRSYFAQ